VIIRATFDDGTAVDYEVSFEDLVKELAFMEVADPTEATKAALKNIIDRQTAG
jgi:hypothetical protein